MYQGVSVTGRTTRTSKRWPNSTYRYNHHVPWCECGWRGKTTSRYPFAYSQLLEHKAAH